MAFNVTLGSSGGLDQYLRFLENKARRELSASQTQARLDTAAQQQFTNTLVNATRGLTEPLQRAQLAQIMGDIDTQRRLDFAEKSIPIREQEIETLGAAETQQEVARRQALIDPTIALQREQGLLQQEQFPAMAQLELEALKDRGELDARQTIDFELEKIRQLAPEQAEFELSQKIPQLASGMITSKRYTEPQLDKVRAIMMASEDGKIPQKELAQKLQLIASNPVAPKSAADRRAEADAQIAEDLISKEEYDRGVRSVIVGNKVLRPFEHEEKLELEQMKQKEAEAGRQADLKRDALKEVPKLDAQGDPLGADKVAELAAGYYKFLSGQEEAVADLEGEPIAGPPPPKGGIPTVDTGTPPKEGFRPGVAMEELGPGENTEMRDDSTGEMVVIERRADGLWVIYPDGKEKKIK